MVIDCPEGAVESVRGLCESFRDDYGTCFGIHISQSALMTCFVPSIGDGQHVHFVDGGNGGYAMAAKELKAQADAWALTDRELRRGIPNGPEHSVNKP